MGPGVDPHLYKASEGDVRRIERADVIFYGGLHLEAKMADSSSGSPTSPPRRLPTRSRTSRLLTPPQFQGQHDPHVWFDVELWSYAVEQSRRLTALDPRSAAPYRRNADAYRAELSRSTATRAASAAIPRKRVMITAHDAFGYFGQAYGIEVAGCRASPPPPRPAPATSSGSPALSPSGNPAIFVESSVPHRTIEAVREAVRGAAANVEIGGTLFSDAMGEPGTPEGTYVGMVRYNVDTIVEGLLG